MDWRWLQAWNHWLKYSLILLISMAQRRISGHFWNWEHQVIHEQGWAQDRDVSWDSLETLVDLVSRKFLNISVLSWSPAWQSWVLSQSQPFRSRPKSSFQLSLQIHICVTKVKTGSVFIINWWPQSLLLHCHSCSWPKNQADSPVLLHCRLLSAHTYHLHLSF